MIGHNAIKLAIQSKIVLIFIGCFKNIGYFIPRRKKVKRHLWISSLITILSLSQAAHADFFIHSNDANACTGIPGPWQGSGKISQFLIGECVYNGSGSISNLDSAGNFTLNLTANKVSGWSPLCPQQITPQLSGNCNNGNVIIRTDYGNLTGNFTSQKGQASGTLTVSPGIDVSISVQLNHM